MTPEWDAGANSPLTNTMYSPLRNACARMLATTAAGTSHYALAVHNQIAPGTDQVGTVHAISAETGVTKWLHEQREATMSLVATRGRAGLRGRREPAVQGVGSGDRRGPLENELRVR